MGVLAKGETEVSRMLVFREMIRQCTFIQEHHRITKNIDANLYILIPKVFTLRGNTSCNVRWSSCICKPKLHTCTGLLTHI